MSRKTPHKERKLPDEVVFMYRDAKGKETRRMVNVVQFARDETRGIWYFIAFCTLAKAMRTFRLDRVHSDITRVETGEIVPVLDWFEDIANERPDEEEITRNRTEDIRRQQNQNHLAIPRNYEKGILFTGFKAARRAELEAMAAAKGIPVKKSITRNIKYLVTGYNAGPKKIALAIECGIQILDEDEFLELIGS